jgi:Cytochrome c7 and related cytochrome c
MKKGWGKGIPVVCLLGLGLLAAPLIGGQQKPASKPPAPAPAKPAGQEKPFYLHALHAKQLGLDCSTCHVPVKEGSVVFQRPGHDQCMVCHADDFGAKLNPKICAQCHTQFPPTGDDLYPFPRYRGKRSILIEFSHALHVDPHGRIDPRTGFRADCTFCHQFDARGVFATIPGHTQCASCHSKPGMKPQLSVNSTTADCRGCHEPEEIENPSFVKGRMIPAQVVTGKYATIKFSHIVHFRYREQYHLNCTTCHSDVLESTSLETLTLPKMVTCAQCHDTARIMPVGYRMNNCQTCHTDRQSQLVKPAFHTESFRLEHARMASEPNATCFVCHTNVAPSATGGKQCQSCHELMRPASHTLRWKEDLHGKYAAMDRQTCAMCHTADFCIRCHNMLPRSHQPLALFKNGGHAGLAMLNERACLTCHTFQNTCAECHTTGLQK